MVWMGENDFDTDPLSLDRNTVGGVVAIRV